MKKASTKQTSSSLVKQLIRAAKKLRDEVDELEFGAPVTHVYNPLRYAWKSHQAYLSLVAGHSPVNLFLGMNPGPWGMAQTGVPFGEIASVRDWMGIETAVGSPPVEHPKRMIEGFDCQRSEVSGRRLWGLFGEKYGTPESFFEQNFVANYCPLVFMESSGKNRTPDKLNAEERESLGLICDEHLASVISAMQPQRVIGVGAYAEKCLARVVKERSIDADIHRILHPSPASPAANKDWAGKVTGQLKDVGVW
ncbi:Uracil DNA glycosylase superfamily protein [Rubripirellula obstinata]|uniref:Uracil DNA glycosylase superfamily protein n=1 Tax=Rubripirellula obstinata TaxID=406547 RepID=A0A5B1CF82_9BACT|nr:uracil-DNA glycosylase family protein [Rubripirellula obstinata]KAA1258871.1 Uracil DNA glycosylase superfamily protein [Rubripirellula obstinata]